MPHICVQSDFINPYRIQSKAGLFQKNVCISVGWDIYLQVVVWIVKLITEYTDTSGGEGWVSACHHCRIVPDDEDPKPLAKVTHHLILVLAKVPRQLPPQPGDGLQAHLVPAANE